MTMRLAVSMGAVQTAVSMATSFISIKITSVYLGPAGLGIVGQMNYFIGMTLGVLSSGLNTGLVRRTVEHGENQAARLLAISTVLRLLLAFGLPVALVIAGASRWLAQQLLHDSSLTTPFILFAALCVMALFSSVVSACAIGAQDYRSVATINISNAIATLLLFGSLSVFAGLEGALIAAALTPLTSLVVALGIARGKTWWPRAALSHGFSWAETRAALGFVPLAAVSAIALPLIQIVVRDNVAAHSGMADVGLLQGVMRLSDMYLGIVSGLFTMYYLPRFTAIKTAIELRRELYWGFILIVPAISIISLMIYLLRDELISMIFTKQFTAMRDLFAYQMIGNVLKMSSWLLAFVLLAKVNPWYMAMLELGTVLIWWGVSVRLIDFAGVQGAVQAYAFVYALYLAAVFAWVCLVASRMTTFSKSRSP